MKLRVAMEVSDTRAEGPGRRYAIWLQGCPMRCPGCCNPEFLSMRGGEFHQVEVTLERVLEHRDLDGLSLLGGEPFAQSTAAAELARGVRAAGKSVVVFSGFTLEEIRADPEMRALLEQTDLLIDGRYERDQPDPYRRWIGSTNQRMHFLSNRISTTDSSFDERDEVEIRLRSEILTVNGRPWGRGLP